MGVLLITSTALFLSCTSDNTKRPEYHPETSIDDELNDGDYYYNGSVTLYSEDGSSMEFPCYTYTGTVGLAKGCRGVVYDGQFYNLDRNEWVTIDGVRYKASDIVD